MHLSHIGPSAGPPAIRHLSGDMPLRWRIAGGQLMARCYVIGAWVILYHLMIAGGPMCASWIVTNHFFHEYSCIPPASNAVSLCRGGGLFSMY